MTKSRKIWLDVVRATAILCVVLCHSVEAFYRPVLLGQLQVSFPLWNIENLLFTVGRMGVPLFLATTGALILPRDYPDVSAFYKKSLLPLFLTTEIWIFFNYIFCCVIEHQTFNISRLLLEMLFLKSSSLSHMWYMPVMLHSTPFSFPVIADIHKPPAVFTAVCSWNHHLFYNSNSKCFFQRGNHCYSRISFTA